MQVIFRVRKADSYGTLLPEINLVCFFSPLLIGGKHPGKITFSFSAAPVKGIPGPQPVFEGLSPKGTHAADTASVARRVHSSSRRPRSRHARTRPLSEAGSPLPVWEGGSTFSPVIFLARRIKTEKAGPVLHFPLFVFIQISEVLLQLLSWGFKGSPYLWRSLLATLYLHAHLGFYGTPCSFSVGGSGSVFLPLAVFLPSPPPSRSVFSF